MTTQALATDAYKFSMAQAGFPLREETFYLSFRTGGCHFVPLDLEAWVRDLVGAIADSLAATGGAPEFLAGHGYAMTQAMQDALAGSVEISAVPKDTWVFAREPILTVTGPSFLVSFLEPQLIWLNYPIQVATAARQRLRGDRGADDFGVATCEAHRDLLRQFAAPILGRDPQVEVDAEGYFARVKAQVEGLIEVVGDPGRLFEVGMRSAVCMEQHRIALEACRAAGVESTSNVALARELGMRPVGTMGHEHVQRWGSDLAAFRAMRDMRRGVPSYLLDTYHTIDSGLPTALDVMRERPHACAVRYDSGNKVTQYLVACEMFREAGLAPIHVLEDGLDLETTRRFEELRAITGVAPERQVYGYGGYIVARPGGYTQVRDRVSGVYKLSETSGEPRMKFGDARGPGKTSVPGRPVIWRRLRGDGPLGIIGQAGEPVATGCVCLNGNPDARDPLQLITDTVFDDAAASTQFALSPETQRLVDGLTETRRP